MERKYYLRGLGVGITMTAIIMGVVMSHNREMTDEEIIARAKELGMVENTVLSDLEKEQTPEGADRQDAAEPSGSDGQSDPKGTDEDIQPADGDTDMAEPENASGSADNAGAEQRDTGAEGGEDSEPAADERDPAQGEGAKPVGEEEPEERDIGSGNTNAAITSAAIKTITVSGGDGSYTVARKLADVGVVTSAESFDSFLCLNGYDKKLRTGTFSIPADASDEQIARIVTGAE